MKNSLLLLAILTFNLASFSQSLLKVGITYTIGKEQSILGKKQDANHEKNVLSSFGAGLTIDVGYAYLTDNFYGPEATFSFFMGKPKTIEHITTKNTEHLTIIKRKMLYFSPSLLVLGNSTDRVNPYLSAGLVFNLWGDVNRLETLKTEANKLIEKNWKVNYGKAIGYKTKIGVLYQDNNDFMPYVEMQYQMIAIKYASEELIHYSIDAKDLLSTLTLSEKKHIYVTSFTHETNNTSNANFDVNQPQSILLNYANYNHFGANVGSYFVLE